MIGVRCYCKIQIKCSSTPLWLSPTHAAPGERRASRDPTEGTSVEKPIKRRISGDRAALEVTQHGAYYQAPSLGGGSGVSAFLTGKARIDCPVPGGQIEGVV